MVVTEAAACATPSIVSCVTGLKDSVMHEKTGLILSKYPTAKQMAQSMIRIIEDQKLRYSLSRKALEVSKRYAWNKSYSEFLSLLADI